MHNTKEKWYALFVATGEEDNVKARINYNLKDELMAIVPKRRMRERKDGKWEEKVRMLFPGYVLLNGKINCMVCNLLRNVPGVIRILSNNDGPQEIYANEIKIISILTADSEIIESSDICVEGGKVVVVDGPLLGLDGYIKAIDKRKGRVKVVLNLMGEPRTVELSVALLQPA